MKALYSLLAVAAIAALGFVPGQTAAFRLLFGVVVPYAAIGIFLAGMALRVIVWARVPVPFRIPATCAQQNSLTWIKSGRLDNPSTTLGVVGRMTLEVLLFRSLFRNSKVELRDGPRLAYGEEKLLWLGALVFHWSFLVILLRHLRFFLEPIPGFVYVLQSVDGFFQVGTPELYATDVMILAALAYLLARRFTDPKVRYISLFTDYFALFLLIGLALSGVLMRHFTRVDLLTIKQLAMGLLTFTPVVPASVSTPFFVHLTLLSALLAYFPFSKLVHMGGIFLSPTRNLANTNRMRRHINPWDYPVKVHTYEEWEDEFRDKIRAAGLPLEKG